jgi:predicted CoA-binding protein
VVASGLHTPLSFGSEDLGHLHRGRPNASRRTDDSARRKVGTNDTARALNAYVERTTRETLLRIYEETDAIAVVGASTTDGKPGHDIPKYLQLQGYRIIPVNPRGGEILGEHSYPSLRDIDVKVDVVDVFRSPEEAEGIAGEAIAIGAKTLWFQPGTHTDEAIALARAAGLTVVARRCMGVTHGWLGLGPGPHLSSVA